MNRLREGITLVELLRYINNSMAVDKVHHNKGKVLAVEKVVDMVGNMVQDRKLMPRQAVHQQCQLEMELQKWKEA